MLKKQKNLSFNEVIAMNFLDEIYIKQKKKFPDVTIKQAWKKLRGEIIELQQARREHFMHSTYENAEKIKYEEADVIIMANKIYQENQDEIAWLILDKLCNYESFKYVVKKWEIVEQRSYHKDKNGNYQHDSES